MSPLPSSFSAPPPSRIVRESTCEETAKAIRVGKFALIRPVTTSDRGALRRHHEVDARRAGELREPHELVLHLVRRGEHQVGQLVDDHDPVRQRVLLVALVVGLDVAHADLGERAVARLHLLDHRLQRADDLVHVDDDVAEREVRDVGEGGELDALRVDEHEPELLR